MTLKHNLSDLQDKIENLQSYYNEQVRQYILEWKEELEQLDFYEWLKTYFKGYNLDNLYDFSHMLKKFVEHEVLRLDETDKILRDKKLMRTIRKARKEGSTSSPYKPLK